MSKERGCETRSRGHSRRTRSGSSSSPSPDEEARIGDALPGSSALRRDFFRGAEGVLRHASLSASGLRRCANRVSRGLHCVQFEKDDDAADPVARGRRRSHCRNRMLRNIGVLREHVFSCEVSLTVIPIESEPKAAPKTTNSTYPNKLVGPISTDR